MSSLRSLRHLSLLVLGIAASPSFGQSDDKKVSFETKAMAVPAALKELSKSCGQSLTASAGFDNVPLILSVHDVKLQDVLDHIAQATMGKWSKTSDGYRLDSDKERIRTLDDKAFQERRDGFAAAVKDYLAAHTKDEAWNAEQVKELIKAEQDSRKKTLDDLAKNNPDIANMQVNISKGSTRAVTPATPALFEVLRRLPPATLAKVGYGQRVVLSSSPTRMQSALPFATGPILDKFVNNHNLLANLAQGSASGTPSNVQVSGGLDLGAKPINSALTKMLVILSRRANDTGLSVEIKFAGADGKFVGSASRWFQPKTNEKPAAELTLSSDKTLEFDAVSLDLARAFLNQQGNAVGGGNSYAFRSEGGSFRIGSNSPTPGAPIAPGALAVLLDPVGHDPQSTFVSDGLLDVAANTGRNLVACLPDTAILRLARSATSTPKAADFLKTAQDGGSSVEDKDGWLLLTPADRTKSAPDQMDRKAARALFTTLNIKGYARLQQLAQFALALGPNPRTSNFGVTTLKLIDPFTGSDLTDAIQSQSSMFQLLALLPSELFEGTRPEAKFTVGALTDAQRACCERLAYGVERGGGIIGDGDMMSIGISDTQGGPNPFPEPGLTDEPTEIMPNGLPVDGTLTLKFKPVDMVAARIKGARGGQFLSAGALGGLFAFQNKQSDPTLAGKILQYDNYCVAQGFEVTLARQFAKGFSGESEYTDAWIKPGATPVAFDALPQTFRDAVAKSKESMSGATLRIGGRDVPPLAY